MRHLLMIQWNILNLSGRGWVTHESANQDNFDFSAESHYLHKGWVIAIWTMGTNVTEFFIINAATSIYENEWRWMKRMPSAKL